MAFVAASTPINSHKHFRRNDRRNNLLKIGSYAKGHVNNIGDSIILFYIHCNKVLLLFNLTI